MAQAPASHGGRSPLLAPLDGTYDYSGQQQPLGNSRLGNRGGQEPQRSNPSANGILGDLLRSSSNSGLPQRSAPPSSTEPPSALQGTGAGVISNVREYRD